MKANKIQNSTICITGAGGSIGSELCKQIIKLNPKKLIMVDNSEHKLFEIKQKFKELTQIESNFLLGDVTRKSFIRKIFE